MEENYDVIVCGTGLTETILAGLLSAYGNKVLHIDKNNFYGGDTASVNLTNLYKLFMNSEQPPEHLGANRDWNIDLIPKFIMAHGKLVKIILHTESVANNLEWKCVDGTYVMQHSKGGMFSSAKDNVYKVPATDSEALKSSLMGLWEKKRCKKFFTFCNKYEPGDQSTWDNFDVQNQPFAALCTKYKLEPNTIDFIGHAVALYTSDAFMQYPAHVVLMKIKLYMDSIGLYDNSPFIYPIYGIGGIPEGFSRLCAIYGGTYMLDKQVDEVLFDEEGKVRGIRCGEECAYAPKVLCDPSYVLDVGKVRPTGRVVRAVCVLNHPIPNTRDSSSCQLIIPQRQTGRQNDIFVCMVSSVHCVCAPGYYVAIVSTTVETDTPEAELGPAFALMGDVMHQFIKVYDTFEPVSSGLEDNLFISTSYDATSHFESACEDVLGLFERITGAPLDYSQPMQPRMYQQAQAEEEQPKTDAPEETTDAPETAEETPANEEAEEPAS